MLSVILQQNAQMRFRPLSYLCEEIYKGFGDNDSKRPGNHRRLPRILPVYSSIASDDRRDYQESVEKEPERSPYLALGYPSL